MGTGGCQRCGGVVLTYWELRICQYGWKRILFSGRKIILKFYLTKYWLGRIFIAYPRILREGEEMLFNRKKTNGGCIGKSCATDRAMEIDTERLYGLLNVIAWDVGYMYRPDKTASVILVTKNDESYDIVDLLECIREKLDIKIRGKERE